jgi:peptide deformylase
MISFDDIDTNHNRVIDKPDKSVAEILDDMTDEYYRINYNNGIGMSSADFTLLRQDTTRRQPIKNHINKTIRPYIKKFLEMM